MLLVSCASDVKFHDCLNYELAHIYRPLNTNAVIQNVSWCKDGSWLALVPNQGNAEIIRTKDDVKLLQSILGIPQPTTAVFQRTTKKNVAMSTRNGGILIYDIKSRGIKKKFANAGTSTNMLDWSLKDTHLAAGGTDGNITLFSNTTNQRTGVLRLPASKSVSVVKFHRTQRQLLGSASDEGVVVVWDINNGKKKFMLQSHKAPVTDLVFSSQNHNLLTSVGLDRTFQCYDTNTGEIALSVLTDQPLSAIDMAPDGHTVAVASSRGNIYIYDLREHHEPLKTISAHIGEIKRILYQPQVTDICESVNITEEKPAEVETERPATDSFALLFNQITEFTPRIEVTEHDVSKKRTSNSTSGDSFLADLGLNTPRKDQDSFMEEQSELSNMGINDGPKKWIDSKSQSNIDVSINHNSLHNKTDAKLLNPTSSTPLQGNRISFVTNHNQSEISPVLINNVNIPTTSEIRNTIKSEVKAALNETMSDLTDYLNRHFLNLQMCLSKQFVYQEAHVEKMMISGHGDVNANLLMQVHELKAENDFLKSKINGMFQDKL